MHAAALRFDLHLPGSHSLKDKRAIIRPILNGCRHRFQVAVAEIDHLDLWQRAGLAVSTVAGDAGHVADVLDRVERYVRSFPEVDVIDSERCWLEES